MIGNDLSLEHRMGFFVFRENDEEEEEEEDLVLG